MALHASIKSTDNIANRDKVLAGILKKRLESYEILQFIDQMRNGSSIQMASAHSWKGELKRTEEKLKALKPDRETSDSQVGQESFACQLRNINYGDLDIRIVPASLESDIGNC